MPYGNTVVGGSVGGGVVGVVGIVAIVVVVVWHGGGHRQPQGNHMTHTIPQLQEFEHGWPERFPVIQDSKLIRHQNFAL